MQQRLWRWAWMASRAGRMSQHVHGTPWHAVARHGTPWSRGAPDIPHPLVAPCCLQPVPTWRYPAPAPTYPPPAPTLPSTTHRRAARPSDAHKDLIFPFHCPMRPQADACRALVALAYLDGGMAGPLAMLQPVVADALRNSGHPQHQQRLQVGENVAALCLYPAEGIRCRAYVRTVRGAAQPECALRAGCAEICKPLQRHLYWTCCDV